MCSRWEGSRAVARSTPDGGDMYWPATLWDGAHVWQPVAQGMKAQFASVGHSECTMGGEWQLAPCREARE